MQSPNAPLDESLHAIVEEELTLAGRLDEALKALGPGAPLSRTAPYFGHLRVELQGRRRDVLVGEQTWLRPGGDGSMPVLGWRAAPLAQVFLLYGEGERFEEEVDDRILEGRVLVRRQLGFEGGRLAWIVAGGRHLERQGEAWREVDPARRMPALVGQAGGWSHPEQRSALDPDQRSVLDRAPDGPVLILGPAGSGKTTVALHRLRSGRGGRNAKQLVVVPEPGLRDMASSRLARLGLPRVPVRTFDDWVEGRVRAVLPGLAKRVAHDAPPAVMRLKRHPVLRQVVAEYVAAQLQALGQALEATLEGEGLAAWLTGPVDRPPLARIDQLERRLQRAGRTPGEVRRELSRARARLLDLGTDRVELFGDRRWLDRILALAGGEVWPGDADATQLRIRRQLDETTEQAFAGVEAERLQAIDGRGLDEDTPARLAGTVDVEDLPILLELLWQKTGEGPLGQTRGYDHILVDEVQDTAPVELATLVRAVVPGGRLTASGDEAQHLDPTVPPTDWDLLGEVMGVGPDRRFSLHYSHRCPAPVLGFARAVLGLSGDGGLETRPGPPVEVTRVASPGQAATLLLDVLGTLMARPGHGEVAIICRDAQSAREIHGALAAAMDARLVLEGAFPFAPGLLVTEVQAVRGLEFDVVVIPDAGAARYPATDEAAAALHLASTRARHQLWVLSPGTPSPLLGRGPGGASVGPRPNLEA